MGENGCGERECVCVCVGVDLQTGLYCSTLKSHLEEAHSGYIPGQAASCCLEEAMAPGAPQKARAGKGPGEQGPAGRGTTKLR